MRAFAALLLALALSGCAALGTPGAEPEPVLGGGRSVTGAGSFGR